MYIAEKLSVEINPLKSTFSICMGGRAIGETLGVFIWVFNNKYNLDYQDHEPLPLPLPLPAITVTVQYRHYSIPLPLVPLPFNTVTVCYPTLPR